MVWGFDVQNLDEPLAPRKAAEAAPAAPYNERREPLLRRQDYYAKKPNLKVS